MILNVYRCSIIDGETWFVLTDICKALDLPQPADIVRILEVGHAKKVYCKPFTKSTGAWLVDLPAVYWLESQSRIWQLDKQIAKLQQQKARLLKV